MKKLILYMMALCLATATMAQSSQYDLGNQLYQQGVYDSALTIYLAMESSDQINSDLYYNIGNCYYKTDHIAGAILYYERALKLDPSDEDIAFNLKLAQSKTIDNIESLPVIFYKKWMRAIANTLAPDVWAWLTIVLLWLCAGAFAGFVLSRSPGFKRVMFYSGIIVGLCLVLSFAVAANRYHAVADSREAIIFDTSVYVKSSPEAKGTNLFMLHEGSKVQLVDEVSGWWKVKIANGNVGWMPASAGKVI